MKGELCWKRVAAIEDQRWSKDDLARLHGECTSSKSLEVWHECRDFLVLLWNKKKIFKWFIWMFLRHCTSQAQLLDSKDQCTLRKERRYILSIYLYIFICTIYQCLPTSFDDCTLHYISVGEHVYFQIGQDICHITLRLTLKPH